MKNHFHKFSFLATLAMTASLAACNPGKKTSSEPVNSGSEVTSVTPSDDTSTTPGNSTVVGNNEGVPAFSLVKSVGDLDLTKRFIIAGVDGATTYAMSDTAKSETLPWYITATPATIKDGKIGLTDEIATWTIAKEGDNYTFKTGGNYLQNYVDGTHYSIHIGTRAEYKNNWTISIDLDGDATVKGETGVYLEWYSSSFCGYKSEKYVQLYQEDGRVVLDTTAGGSTTIIDNTVAGEKRWAGLDFTKYGEDSRNQLGALITGRTTSYSNCLEVGKKAAAYPNENSSTFIPFYHEAKSSEAVSGGCNREHTWPKSRGGNLIEKDPLIIRQSLSSENSSRGNSNYALSGGWDPASCGYEGARGESARVILYAATRYGKSLGLKLSNSFSTSKSMGTLKDLLAWNAQYPPTDFEKTVNDRYEKMGYARNPFVDHPIYANYIWDTTGFRTSTYTQA